VAGKQVAVIREDIKKHLGKRFKIAFDVTVTLAESRAMQQIRGEHLVRPDGKVALGTYGSVYVTGMTLEQAKQAIQLHLSTYLAEPEISLDIAGFNSRVYYVVFNLAGAGQVVHRLPCTGNETVMDAIAELKGLPAGSFRKKIWVARPSPADSPSNQIMPDQLSAAAGRSHLRRRRSVDRRRQLDRQGDGAVRKDLRVQPARHQRGAAVHRRRSEPGPGFRLRLLGDIS
jgi:protein involved in polysaccharide export with SLBB domain